jgi:hypothetical protein
MKTEPMDPKDIRNLRAFLRGADDEIDGELWDGRDGMEAFMAALLDDRDWYRERAELTADDVAHAGVTPSKRDAWLGARKHMQAEPDAAGVCRWILHGETLCFTTPLGEWEQTARVIHSCANAYGRSTWDILDEMAAMEVDP